MEWHSDVKDIVAGIGYNWHAMTAALALLLVLIPVSYLLGSIPFGLLVGLWRGVDVRKAGSGNIGATNVGRLLGGRFFFLVFFLDLLKGMLPMLAAAALLRGKNLEPGTYLLWLAIGGAAICGHLFSLFLSFKGGKGVATSAGVALGLFPFYTFPALIAISMWLLLLKLTRYISLASMAAAVVFPIAYITIGLLQRPPWPILGRQWPLLIFAVLIALMIVFKHRSNLTRLRAGTEPRFGTKPAVASTSGANGSRPQGPVPAANGDSKQREPETTGESV